MSGWEGIFSGEKVQQARHNCFFFLFSVKFSFNDLFSSSLHCKYISCLETATESKKDRWVAKEHKMMLMAIGE
jgi:hypothetical protein